MLLIGIEGMTREERLIAVETAGSIAWFAMDASWMLGVRLAAAALAVPTLVLNVLVFRFAPRAWVSWLVSGAMTAWACMNVLWMAHDFRMIDWGLVASKGCLGFGAALLTGAIIVGRSDALRLLYVRFRRLRLRA